ncbi:hypothetical protein XH97_02095 [Bradyrhizobium sp. CCBAU 53380]|nr:hypothetical protein [Bradyrhizobium sp. CCBAU 53380]
MSIIADIKSGCAPGIIFREQRDDWALPKLSDEARANFGRLEFAFFRFRSCLFESQRLPIAILGRGS